MTTARFMFVRENNNFDSLMSTLPAAFQARFEILAKIGTGGTGTVYKGWDKTLQRSLALKVLNPDQTSGEKIARLHREAKTLCKLKHPNIVSIYDFIVTTDEKPVMVMECVEGTSLDNLLDSEEMLSVHDSLDIVMQVCSAMEYAHARGVLHRDLTPSNILVRRNERDHFDIKVVDFGIAKVENITDKTIAPMGSLVGSVTVISPQQARGEAIDARSDIYSLGCTMYKILTGEFPYVGESLIEIVNRHIHDPIPSLADGNQEEEYPDALNQIVVKAMQKKPEDRFQSMEEMYDAIDGVFSPYLEGTNEPHRVRIRARRLRSSHLVSVGIAIMLIGALVLTSALLRYNPEDKLSEPPAETKIETRIQNSVNWISPQKAQLKAAINLLREHPEYSRLDLRGVNISDHELARFADLPLTSIDLRHTRVTDKSMTILSRCKSLRSVLLSDCKNVSDKGLECIANLPNLICLAMNGTSIGDEGIAALTTSNKSLRTLHVANCPKITDQSIPNILAEAKLESLNVGGTGLKKDGVRELLNRGTKLGYIGLSNLDLEDKDIPQMLKLYRIDLSKNPKLTQETLEKLKKWSNLYFLVLIGCNKIDPAEMRVIEGIHSSRHLVVLPADFKYVDTEGSYEPRLYDLAGDNEEQIKTVMIGWNLDN